jgi:hypothetical protein
MQRGQPAIFPSKDVHPRRSQGCLTISRGPCGVTILLTRRKAAERRVRIIEESIIMRRTNVWKLSVVASVFAWLGGIAGCIGSASSTNANDFTETRQALAEPEAEAVARVMAPLRTLGTPGKVTMRSIEETIPTSGNFLHTFHVYQPDGTGEGIRFDLAAKTSSGTIDSAQSFQSVVLTTHPGEADESQQTLANASGQKVYTLSSSQQGWYRLSFRYVAPNAGRTLQFKAYDAAGNSLSILWDDPAGTAIQVRAKVYVAQASQAYLKGGAYRNSTASEYSYAENVKVDTKLLYKRAFDQGMYNFPLGYLSAGEHTVEFALYASSSSSKFWFSVNDQTFDPNGVKVAWDPVQFLYFGAMHTGDYDAWSEGVAFAQGAALVHGVRPPVVRRGTTVSVAVEHASLNGTGLNAILRIYPFGSGSETNWPTALPAGYDYAGGIYTAAGFQTRYREHWRVSVPADAPVGRYVVKAISPGGVQIGTVMFYVVHNPYLLFASGAILREDIESYCYDEDEDGTDMHSDIGFDRDWRLDHFTAIYRGSLAEGYNLDSKITGAFRRTQSETDFSMLDYAVAAGEGTTTEFETMRRLYRLVNQRIKYNNPDLQDDTANYFLGNAILTIDDALTYSKPGTALPEAKTNSGECTEFGTSLVALARASGILSRVLSSEWYLGGWGNHVFAEAYVPNLPQHGGRTTSSNTSPASDTDHWYAFDPTDPEGNNEVAYWIASSEAIAPRSMYGRSQLILRGPPMDGPVVAVTTPRNWDPFTTDLIFQSGVSVETAAYMAGPEFWLTESGVTGWLGFGEKDVYRISKTTTRAKAVRVRTLPSGGEYLVPKLCVGSVANTPVMPEKCANPSTHVDLPVGESYVVVLNESGYIDSVRGDSVKYILELEY